MKHLRRLVYLTSFICLPVLATVTFDKQEVINGVSLQTGKQESIRHYEGNFTHTFSHPLEVVKNGITNFSEKCNNQFKGKRKLTSKDVDCKFHAEQLVESLVIKDIGLSWEKAPLETDRYLVARQVYRRGTYRHYDLVQIFEGMNEKNQKTLTITLNMLADEEVAAYIQTDFKKDSSFIKNTETFTLTATTPEKTDLKYHYHAETDHWLLNKQILVPQVFATISQGITDMLKTLDITKREVASHE